ncbi:MAG: glycosyltransferase, partial [Lachnospiraceae bacterium]|nr:glycosyltransferase [Lachnospiraceae bacterium]
MGGYSRDELLNRFSIPDNKYVLLLNSRIVAVKNHMLMVEAVHELPDEIKSKIVVLCTGEKSGSYYESLLQKIDEYNLKDSFIFVGWVNPYEILTVSDFLILPSVSEGFALNVAEAFFAREPTARTATAGWEDLKTGCLRIYPDRTTEIKEIIMTLVKKGPEIFSEQIYR